MRWLLRGFDALVARHDAFMTLVTDAR